MEHALPKPVSESMISNHTYKVFPNDLNSNGTVFGGEVMAILDRLALVVAERHSGRTCVTASVDALNFLGPAKGGDILLFSAAINRSWNSSMEIGLKVVAENYKTQERRHIVSAYFTFVALDENNKPISVPQVICDTYEQKRRYEEAEYRRNARRHEKKQRELRRAAAISEMTKN